MPWYTGDWLKSPEVRAMPPDYRGLWFDCLCYMWESTERGVLVKPNGKPYSKEDIVRMVGLDNQNSSNWLTYIIENEVCSIREIDKAIYSRHMVKDEEIRQIRKKVGKMGGNPNLVKQNLNREVNQIINQGDNLNTEDEDEDEDENENRNENDIETEVVRNWNDFALQNGLSGIKKLSPRRKAAVRARFQEKEFDFTAILRSITESAFLCGQNDKGWQVDFDFVFLSGNNYLKILEGKYRDRDGNNGQPKLDAKFFADQYEKHFGTGRQQG